MKRSEAHELAERAFAQNLSSTLKNDKDVVGVIVLTSQDHVTGNEPRAAALSLKIGQPISGQIAEQIAARKVQSPMGNTFQDCAAAVHPADKLS